MWSNNGIKCLCTFNRVYYHKKQFGISIYVFNKTHLSLNLTLYVILYIYSCFYKFDSVFASMARWTQSIKQIDQLLSAILSAKTDILT